MRYRFRVWLLPLFLVLFLILFTTWFVLRNRRLEQETLSRLNSPFVEYTEVERMLERLIKGLARRAAELGSPTLTTWQSGNRARRWFGRAPVCSEADGYFVLRPVVPGPSAADGIRALAAIEEHVPGLLVWFLDLDGSPVEQAIYIFGLAAVAALSTDAGDSRYAV